MKSRFQIYTTNNGRIVRTINIAAKRKGQKGADRAVNPTPPVIKPSSLSVVFSRLPCLTPNDL
jgi:hypothetical protein